MKKIRVQIGHSYENESLVPDFEKEFIGKTGTVVWATKAVWGGYQCDVELDIPHTIFGSQCRTIYIEGKSYKNHIVGTLIDGSTMEELRNLSDILDDNWTKYRKQSGDAFSWSELEKKLPLDTEL